jgi:hypothetical protein
MSKKTTTSATPARQRITALVLASYSLKAVKTGDSLFIKAASELYTKPDFDQKTGERKKDKHGEDANLHLVQVMDLDDGTGEICEMVVPVIVLHAFEQCTPLVGRCFELVKGVTEASKATKWLVYEIANEG